MGEARALHIERRYRATADDALRAWTEPALVREWLRPLAGLAAAEVEIDARPGGRWRVEFRPVDGPRLELDGRIDRLAPDGLALELVRRDGGASSAVRLRVESGWKMDGPELCLWIRQHGVAVEERADIEAGWRAGMARMAGAFPSALDANYARMQGFPRFRSRHGGTWPDLSDARARLNGKQALGWISAAEAELFEHWIEHGYVVLRGAVAPALVERIDAELDALWRDGDARLRLEVHAGGVRRVPRLEPRYRDVPHKLLEFHAHSAAVRDAQFAPPIRRFLELLFERPPLAFQSLTFRWGSEQALHQDTAYVALRSPLELVGCWIALEDVRPGSGELQYHVGSHRIPEYLWYGRGRAKPYEVEDDADYLRHVRQESERAGCRLERFLPRRGDALLWHADLVHGGAPRVDPSLTRKSLVTHYCPLDVDPLWYGAIPSSPRLEHAPGAWYCYPLG